MTAEAVAVMEATDASGWDRKYGSIGPLPYGARAEQGPRETMEDFVTVVPRGNCGFLYAGCHLARATGHPRAD